MADTTQDWTYTTDFNALPADMQKLIAANAAGYSSAGPISPQEYLTLRGGLDLVSGWYGDTPDYGRVSNADYLNYARGGATGVNNLNIQLTKQELQARLAGQMGGGSLEEIIAAMIQQGTREADVLAAAEALGYKLDPATLQSLGINPAAASGTGVTGTGTYGSYGTQTTGAFATLTPEKQAERMSAWSLLKSEFDRYGLGTLIDPLKNILLDGASDAEMLLRLRQTDAYKQRFAANETRISQGLRALSEAEYIELEDQYSRLMRAYGLPSWYTETGVNGRQAGLEQFIANDVSPTELEDRIQIAVNRIQNGPQEVMDALKKFYPNITDGDVLAYILDPKKALPVLQRQVQTAEIGGEALRYGLNADKSRAEELATLGVDQATARKNYETIGGGLDRGSTLGSLYGENYDQNTAEQEVFGLNDSANAGRKRRKIIGMETANFSGSTGVRGGALDANRAGAF